MRKVHVYRVKASVLHVDNSSGYIEYLNPRPAPKLALGYPSGADKMPDEVAYEFKTEKLPIWQFHIPGEGDVYAAIDPKLLNLVELSVKAKHESKIEAVRMKERAEAKKVCAARIAKMQDRALSERASASETSRTMHRIGMRDGAALALCVAALAASVAIFFGVIDFNLGIW